MRCKCFFNSKTLQGFKIFSLVVVILLAGGLGNLSAFTGFAEIKYSNVLEDLQKDSEFNVADYIDDPNDFSIQVIQIAESDNGELFLYTYQPCQRTTYLVAKDINMSLSDTVDNTSIYKLELLSCEGSLCKYLVKGVKVSSDTIRYYNITSIYRDWDNDIDGEPCFDDGSITYNSYCYEIGKVFKAVTFDNHIEYYFEYVDTIEIINPYVGFIRYYQGFKLYDKACDSHYVAFSTDKRIDKLLSADVYFLTQEYESLDKDFGPEVSHVVFLSYTDEVTSEKEGFLGKTYTWNRIEKVSDFLKNEKVDSSVVEKIKDKKWVLRFYESDYFEYHGFGYGWYQCTSVSNVSILRLGFETNGKLYNLGAVSNKISGSSSPSNHDPVFKNMLNFSEKIFDAFSNFINGSRNTLDVIVFIVFILVAFIIVILVFKLIFQIIKIINSK